MKQAFLMLAFFLLAVPGFSQQWTGNTNLNDDLFRYGNVGLGSSPAGSSLRVYRSSFPIFTVENSLQRLQVALASGSAQFDPAAQAGDIIFRSLGGYDGRHNMIFTSSNVSQDGRTSIRFGDQAGLWVSMVNNRVMRVDGNIVAKQVTVKTDVWADYVFSDEYKLRPLEEVAAFIKEYKHLPEVPSEQEVIEQGVNVSKMSATLLKKIEELTLYLIEVKQENQELTKKITELERKVK